MLFYMTPAINEAGPTSFGSDRDFVCSKVLDVIEQPVKSVTNLRGSKLQSIEFSNIAHDVLHPFTDAVGHVEVDKECTLSFPGSQRCQARTRVRDSRIYVQ
jgi:hypothetical protein